ncbi:MAG: hypothetical protein EBU90_16395 [Proteobacteria bacterium]|nr:hypothetical protein [Pseudomonadota bacterium]
MKNLSFNNLGENYLRALTKKYEAQMEEAIANLSLYFSTTNLASIGEHSDLLEEHDKWLESYANAKDKLECLLELYPKETEKING